MKHYNVLSQTVIGVILLAILDSVIYRLPHLYDGLTGVVVYLAVGYILGYCVNAIGRLIERALLFTTGGIPSDKLLTPVYGQEWTGINKVKFFETQTVITKLKAELNDENASTRNMFGCAMHHADLRNESRFIIYKTKYEFTRLLLTSSIIVFIILICKVCPRWGFWVASVLVMLIAWYCFREQSYYYTREVLEEYLKDSDN